MMNSFELPLFIFLITVLACFRFLSTRRTRGNLPPGPYPVPIFGNIFQLGPNPHRSLAKLSKTYGPLMSLHLGTTYTVIVSSPEIAKEILLTQDQVFAGRYAPAAVHALDHHKTSVISLSPGKEWRKLRKICKEQLLSTQRLDATEGLRSEKLQKLTDYVARCCDSGREMDIGEAAFVTMLNLTSTTLFSLELVHFDDSNMNNEFKETIHGVTRYLGVPNIVDFFPILESIDPQGIKRKIGVYFRKLLAVIEDIVNQRLKLRGALDYQKQNDLLETLLDLSEGTEYELTAKEINHLLMDLVIAGGDTSGSTTEWAMTELLLNPEKLSKAKDELRSVIGKEKQVKESDFSKLPYFQAMIKEVFRLHPAGPLLGPHRSLEDATVNGYRIPKDTRVLVNAWGMSREPSIWSNPDSFEPERFLDRKIDFKGKDFELIPFSSGRRICVGMQLASRMLNVMVATLIHNFDWKFELSAETKEIHKGEVFGLALQKKVPLKATPIKCQA